MLLHLAVCKHTMYTHYHNSTVREKVLSLGSDTLLLLSIVLFVCDILIVIILSLLAVFISPVLRNSKCGIVCYSFPLSVPPVHNRGFLPNQHFILIPGFFYIYRCIFFFLLIKKTDHVFLVLKRLCFIYHKHVRLN